MAIFFQGAICNLCGLPINAAADAAMFSPFVSDRADPLFVFSDSVAHAVCLERHPLSADATHWHAEAVRNRTTAMKVCEVCGKSIQDPDDYFGTGLLSRSVDSPLFEYNFAHVHQSHLDQWPRYEEFRRCMEATQAEGGWQGPTLEFGAKLRWVVRGGG